MPTSPEVRVVKIEYGPFPEAPLLNAQLAADTPLLLTTLDIHWDLQDTVSAVGSLEGRLLAFSPGFARHQCRGERAYHVFLGSDARPDAAFRASNTGAGQPYDGCLALAHLIEHAIIDFQCEITREKRCSGITAAHRSTPGRFDVIVECRDRRVGCCCLVLAMSWLTSAAAGERLGPSERNVISAARFAYSRPSARLTAPEVALGLGCPDTQAHQALLTLRELGFLEESPCTVNFSGIPGYRIAADDLSPQPGASASGQR